MANKIKNRPVGGHEVELLLSCNHMNREPVEAAIFVPSIGEKRVCQTCSKLVIVLKVGTPYWVDKEEE